MKDRQSAEQKEEPNFRFFRFLFFELWPFQCNFFMSSPQFSMKFRDNSKNKNWRIFLLLFPFYLSHSARFLKFPPLLRRGGEEGKGLHVRNQDTAKKIIKIIISKNKMDKKISSFKLFQEFFFSESFETHFNPVASKIEAKKIASKIFKKTMC